MLKNFISKFIANVHKMSETFSAKVEMLSETSHLPQPSDNHSYEKKSKKEKKLERKLQEKAYRKARRQDDKRQNIGFSELPVNLSQYYFSNGFRRVHPYYFTYETHTKGRWLQRKLLDVLDTEFHCHSHFSFTKAIETGKVKVNGESVTPDYILKDNDKILHTVHRHELPVLNLPIKTVFEDEHTLVINKPSSIPIHPCGRYNLNSLIFILAKEQQRTNLRLVHRLDRMTSGLLIFAKNYDTANRISAEISGREVKKTYLALVEGEFPGDDAWLNCDMPLGVLCAKFGVQRVLPLSEGGKEAVTEFRRRWFDPSGNQSLVECRPKTGRTHQIRIHLQFLGHPIVNDPIYNCEAWGEGKGKGGHFGKPMEEVVAALGAVHTQELHVLGGEEPGRSDGAKEPDREEPEQKEPEDLDEPEGKRLKLDAYHKDPHCVGCRTIFKDPKPENLQLFLHAFQYEGPDWSYKTDPPGWADLRV